MINNPFCIDFMNSRKKLWRSSLVLHSDGIMETPIRFNPMLWIDFKRKWFSKQITVLSDVFNTLGSPIELEQFKSTFSLKTF